MQVRKNKQPKIQHKTTLVQLPLTTLGQETRRAYSTTPPSSHGASYVTASVQSDHLLHYYMLPVFFDTDQSHSTPRCAEVRLLLQQAAAASLNMSASIHTLL